MTLIDGDKIITALLYNPQSDEFHERKMSIIDFVNLYSDEGLTKDDDIFDKIRAEIANIYCCQYCENPYTAAVVKEMALKIIDKYRESEVQDADSD